MGNTVIEDFDNFNRVSHMFSKLMNDGARDNEDAIGFGYRYDDYETKTQVELSNLSTNVLAGNIAGNAGDPATIGDVNAQLNGLSALTTGDASTTTRYHAKTSKVLTTKWQLDLNHYVVCFLSSSISHWNMRLSL